MADIEYVDDNEAIDQKNEEHPIPALALDSQFVNFIKSLESNIRESIVKICHPKQKVAVIPAELVQKSGESDGEYIKRLKAVLEKQGSMLLDLLSRDSAKTGGDGSSHSGHSVNVDLERMQSETHYRDHQEVSQQNETDLKSFSDAYNSLEQANYHLEIEIKASTGGLCGSNEGRQKQEEAQKEN